MCRTPSTRALLISLATAAVLVSPVLADSTRTLRLEHGGAVPFAVENLAGTMRVTAGTGDRVVAVATVHAEDDATAALMKFEQVTDENGVETLRVVYPTGKYTTFRYSGGDGAERESQDTAGWLHGWLHGWLGGGNSSTVTYGERKVTVKSSSGILLYADLEVQVPRRNLTGTFRNLVGTIHGQGLEGKLLFDGASGDLSLEDLKGDITADTGSGDVSASRIEGTFTCDTGSGDCDLNEFRGEKVKCDVGSGDIHLSDGVARLVDADTGSGDVNIKEFDLEELDADTGSGDVLLENRGGRLAVVKAGTGSGDVTIRLSPSAGFEARASQGSGDLVNRFSDAEPIMEDEEVVGYRRGDGRTRIRVSTGSGDFVLEPTS